MKRLTLEEAIGQTLLAKYELGSDILLRFSGGCVRLETHFESYDIYDYTDGDDPLGRLERMTNDQLDALHVGGFIDGHAKNEAIAKREEDSQAWERRREESARQQYEALRERFEPK